ncbi:NACHT, LRR and PYD domains-containing protein 1b allele 2-like [Melanotaenia boesemani]|uniref:NACHT, LRR and PYD domains-containing protein 1b allele 2-like n=1 Tax=Melanotaenia boesemani TaxID=1250792 RepID=UPI001C051B6E|nr:NACHT, LRR and PYD domains-containing protein 1b allele 2-like [Melanotaenia boesemani]
MIRNSQPRTTKCRCHCSLKLNYTFVCPTPAITRSQSARNRKEELCYPEGDSIFPDSATSSPSRSSKVVPYCNTSNVTLPVPGPSIISHFTINSCEEYSPPITLNTSSLLFNNTSPPVGRREVKTSVFTEEHKVEDSFEFLSLKSEDLTETAVSVSAIKHPVTHTLLTQSDHHIQSIDSGLNGRDYINLSRSLSFPSLTQKTNNQSLTQTKSLPDMKLNSSCEEFTPDFIDDESDETYRFQGSSPGLFQCTVTGLLFHMEGEGEVCYRIVTWNRRLLSQHHKKPAGPLFNIKCLQQSVCQLHLPHCEILSTGGGRFLSVAHIKDEGIEFIKPHDITETHVIINITGFSGFGNVKDEDSPPDPVQALVLLFYKPPDDPDLEHLINVLMLPKNVSLRDVLRTRKKLVGDEMYIETSPHCKLQPKQVYTLSTGPGADSVLVQPSEAEFDEESYDNYFPSFQVTYETVMKHMKLFLRDSSSNSVWERRVCLSTSGVKTSCGSTRVNLRPHEQLLEIRSNFIRGVSGPVLQSLLDKLLEKKVMTNSEREAAEEIKSRGEKTRSVLDTVRKKGEAASSEMVEFLCEVDPFLCEHLGLM